MKKVACDRCGFKHYLLKTIADKSCPECGCEESTPVAEVESGMMGRWDKRRFLPEVDQEMIREHEAVIAANADKIADGRWEVRKHG